jgi:hypothetical protein
MGLLRRYAPRNDMWLGFLRFHQEMIKQIFFIFNAFRLCVIAS